MIRRQLTSSGVIVFALLLAPGLTGCSIGSAGAASNVPERPGSVNSQSEEEEPVDTDVLVDTEVPVEEEEPVDTAAPVEEEEPIDTAAPVEEEPTDTAVPVEEPPVDTNPPVEEVPPVEEIPPVEEVPSAGDLSGYTLYVDPESNASRQASIWRQSDPEGAMLMDRMATQPLAVWIGDWFNDVAGSVDDEVTAGGSQLRTFVAYNIPHRDCGAWSAGGVADKAAYTVFIADMARGLNGRPAIVILEPDALPLTHCLTSEQTTERYTMLSEAVDTLTAAGAFVYIDAGDSDWLAASDIASRLVRAGVHRAAGFALNVSHTETTEDSIAYAEVIRAQIGDVHYIIDTDRNGRGPTVDHEWCNPLGVAIGADPSLTTGVAGLDAYLWVKPPGESDGSCNGGPIAGAWWPAYARDLAAAAWL